MTEITHEALNEIADALRRGCDGSIPIEAAEKLECIADALRTGQLIHAVPSGDEVEAVAGLKEPVRPYRNLIAETLVSELDAVRGKQ